MKAALPLMVGRWLFGKVALLVLLVVLLLLAPSVWELWGVARTFDPVVISKDLEKSVSGLAVTKETAKDEGTRRIQALQSRLDATKRERDERAKERCFLPTCSLVKESHLYRLDMEVTLLEEALAFSKEAVKGSLDCRESNKLSTEVRDLHQLVVGLEKTRPPIIPKSAEQKGLEEQLAQKEARGSKLKFACATF